LEAAGKIRDWQEFAILCTETYGLKCRRLDLFKDDRSGILNIEELERKLEDGECTTHAQEYERRSKKARGMGGKRITDTLNIGSRRSESFMRIYDKTLESRPKGRKIDEWRREHGHHIRVELELKGKRAHAAMKRLAQTGLGQWFIRGLMRAFIDFKVAKADGKNGNRVPTWEPWAEFLNNEDKVKLDIGYVQPTLDKALYYLEHQYGPTLATWAMAMGGDKDEIEARLISMCVGNVTRMRRKHYGMLLELAA
jgi:DNA relaxase NicK